MKKYNLKRKLNNCGMVIIKLIFTRKMHNILDKRQHVFQLQRRLTFFMKYMQYTHGISDYIWA
jgi:hypothetical protein